MDDNTDIDLRGNEIQRLRKENATLTAERDALWRLTDRLFAEHDALRAERDEVRQSYCSLMEAYRGGDGRVTANKLGWGYLFEEPRRPKKEDGSVANTRRELCAARRELCRNEAIIRLQRNRVHRDSEDVVGLAKEIAVERGWDCFKDNP